MATWTVHIGHMFPQVIKIRHFQMTECPRWQAPAVLGSWPRIGRPAKEKDACLILPDPTITSSVWVPDASVFLGAPHLHL